MANRSRIHGIHEMRRRCQIMTGGPAGDRMAGEPVPPQQMPPQQMPPQQMPPQQQLAPQMPPQKPSQPPQITPQKSAAEKTVIQAVEVAKQQTMYTTGPMIKQEPGKPSITGMLL